MELPFLKNKQKNQGGTGPVVKADPTQENSMDDDLLSQVWDELLHAFETKNKTMGMDALTALVHYIQDQDQKQDQEDKTP